MTMFMADHGKILVTFYRVATIAACASIVVTAVYLLRAIGQSINGPISEY